MPDLQDFYARLRGGRRHADDLAAVDRRLPRVLRAAAGGRPRHRLDPPLRRHLGHATTRRCRRARSSPSAATTAASRCSTRARSAAGSGSCCSRPRPARATGPGAAEVAQHALAARDGLRIWFSLDTLEYLRRGGRIGGAQAWLGGALKIKPILSLESEILPVERVRTSRGAFERMVKYAQELHDGGADAWCVQHIQAPDLAQRLVERARDDLRLRAAVRRRGRSGHRRPRRPRNARHRRDGAVDAQNSLNAPAVVKVPVAAFATRSWIDVAVT